MRTKKIYQHGFDLTEFKSAKTWVNILNTLKIGLEPIRQQGWLWEGPGIKIITANNPITGEHYTGDRDIEIGYASYVGLEGDEGIVLKAVELIKKRSHRKGESKGTREFI